MYVNPSEQLQNYIGLITPELGSFLISKTEREGKIALIGKLPGSYNLHLRKEKQGWILVLISEYRLWL